MEPETPEKHVRILMLYTGGTIGMQNTPRGYAPAPGFLGRQLASLSQFQDPTQPLYTTPRSRFGRRIHYDIKEYDPLLDSSNMSYSDWQRIATDIYASYNDYDAFVVLHGTDTMGYTASALSFMFENLSKTVVITGSQIPLSEVRNDGIDNLLGALTIAGHYEIPEVLLYFRSKAMRGNRAWKVNASGFNAFQSPNFEPLVEVGVEIEVYWDRILLPPENAEFHVSTDLCPDVATMRLFPGITERTIRNFLQPPLRGCVLETYGTGNAPDTRADFLAALKEAHDRGVVIVNITQCTKGGVSTHYAAGMALKEVGVVPGADMTTEAAVTKLMYLLGKGYEPDEVRELISKSIRGELTEQESVTRFSFRDKGFVLAIAKTLKDKNVVHKTDIKAIENVLMPVLMCSIAGLGDLEGLKKIVQFSDMDVTVADYDGRTPLHLSSSEGHVDVCRYLLERKANPNALDRWGGTPLHDAIRHKHEAVMTLLKEYGARLDGEVGIAEQLIRAASIGDVEQLRLLLAGGIDPNVRDYDGRTALHVASAEGKAAAVDLLLRNGAKVDALDRWGHSAVEEARRTNHTDIVERLEQEQSV